MANGKKNKQNNAGQRNGSNSSQSAVCTRPNGRSSRRTRPGNGGRRNPSALEISRGVFNAFHPAHMPLTVPTAPHMMVTTKTSFELSDYMMLLGPMIARNQPLGSAKSNEWTNYIGLSLGDSDVEVQELTSTPLLGASVKTFTVPLPTTDRDDFECVPAAVSFQVTAVDSLTDASGVVYLGRGKSIMGSPTADGTTIGDLQRSLISFTPHKVMSTAALSMRSQQVNLLPGNQVDMADFESLEEQQSLGNHTWNEAGVTTDNTSSFCEFAAFKPGYILNPYRKQLIVNVAVQWRVRLSVKNPMHASQTHYAPTPPSVWHQITAAAESLGHGVEDVAEAGTVGFAGYLASGGVRRGMEMVSRYALRAAGAALSGLEWAAPRIAMAAL